MGSKLRVKLGRIKLEFEGSEDFIKQELMTPPRSMAPIRSPIARGIRI